MSSPTAIHDLHDIIDRIVTGGGIVSAIGEMEALAVAASRAHPEEATNRLAGMVELRHSDPLAAYLAVYALGSVRSSRVDSLLVDLLDSEDAALAQHAAWSLSRRRPVPDALGSLDAMVDRGGFSRMMAELALEAWLREIPELIWRMGPHRFDEYSRLAERPRKGPAVRPATGRGLRIAQVLMQGRVDSTISSAGSGDGGGLITLQVGLTRELARREDVDDVYLVTRLIGGESGFDRRREPIGRGILARLEFGGEGYLGVEEMWAFRSELERELRRFLLSHGPFDALHLRFADVGAFVAARLGEQLDIPVFFTLAPDPHGVLAAAEESGELRRRDFARAEADHHYLFRAWLVNWMLRRADRLALLPRRDQHAQLRDLLGVDVSDPGRFVVIPEGIDLEQVQEARATIAGLDGLVEAPAVISELEAAVARMPEHRHGLPLLLTVGRFNRVKGMERVVEAWAEDPEIRAGFNLVVVGGSLRAPSTEEQQTISAISARLGEQGSEGLVMLGHRSHRDVTLVMAAASGGTPGAIGSSGVYVSGSEKEEFGLAIVEAMAAGLAVVAPAVGGPGTYIDHLFTGYLADTRDVEDIRRGIRWAVTTRKSEVRADAARRKIRSGYSLSAMASALISLYDRSEAESTAS